MHNQNKNMISLLLKEFIRIKDVMIWTAFSFGGYILGLSSIDLSNNIITLLVFLISTFFIMSFTFAINNYYDIDSDKKNPRRMNINAIALDRISKKNGSYFIIILTIIPLIITYFFRIEAFIFCAFILFLGWGYSAPPLRIKNKPIFDIVLHFLGFFLFVIWGSFIAGSIGLINWLAAISIGIFSCIGQVDNHIRDYSYDKESGTQTFAVWIGYDNAITTLKILTLIHLIFLIPLILLYSLSYYITIIIILVIPILGLILLKPKKGSFLTKGTFIHYFTFIIGGAVYLSCLIYYICFLLGMPTLRILDFIGLNNLYFI